VFAARAVAGKAIYAVSCLLAAVVLVASGYAHKVVGLTTGLGKGVAINNSPSVGAMNILVMGLESRTDYQGNELDHHMQVVLHSGSNGGQATNTLILLHIFAGGKKAVGFSISRDDLVNFPQPYLGYSKGKIDAAYGWAWQQYLNDHAAENKSDRYLHANQAGQAATIATVDSITGVKVDHFVEVNLAGFYYLAQAFNGLEVCLKPYPGSNGLNLTDHDPFAGTFNSGFDAYQDGYSKAKWGRQYLHLTPAQSLAFVRSRDTLPGTDLGRTKRQQAAIDYVIWNLKHTGMYSDLGKLNALLGTASKYLITDSTFNLLDFAPSMGALSGQNVGLTTLPYTTQNGVPLAGYPTPQDVNNIDVPTTQRIVRNAFYPPPPVRKKAAPTANKGTAKKAAPVPPASTVTVDVYNGDLAAGGLAARESGALVAHGYRAGAVLEASAQAQTVETGTQVFYGAGASANAAKIATAFGAVARALASLAAGHVEVLIGSASTVVPPSLTASAAKPTPTSTAGSDSGQSGSAVTVTANTKFGTPCVY
jgi:anionic cell wall polymer biosynthesis LytR-Cps2A-Psr (LCP) family protein